MPKRLIPTSTIAEFLEDCKTENAFGEVTWVKIRPSEWLSIPFHRRWRILVHQSSIQRHKRKWAEWLKKQAQKENGPSDDSPEKN